MMAHTSVFIQSRKTVEVEGTNDAKVDDLKDDDTKDDDAKDYDTISFLMLRRTKINISWRINKITRISLIKH